MNFVYFERHFDKFVFPAVTNKNYGLGLRANGADPVACCTKIVF